MNRKLKLATIVGCLAALGGGVAFGAIPDSGTGVYTACVKNTPNLLKGDMRDVYMIDKQVGKSCQSGYTEKAWNQTGPTGPAGATGPQGPAGGEHKTYVGGAGGSGASSAHEEARCDSGVDDASKDLLLSATGLTGNPGTVPTVNQYIYRVVGAGDGNYPVGVIMNVAVGEQWGIQLICLDTNDDR